MKPKKVVRTRDVINKNFLLLDGLMTVHDALLKMKEKEPCAIIVNKRTEHDEYGMVLLEHIAKNVLAEDRSPARVNLYEIMVKPLINISADMDIRYCARLFVRYNIVCAPVLDKGEVVGIISLPAMVINGLVHFD